MQIDYTVKQGNAGRELGAEVTLNGTPVNPALLAGATITFRGRNVDDETDEIGGAATHVADTSRVSYALVAGDVTTPGYYVGEFHVVFAGGAVVTFPNGSHLVILITPNLE